MNEELYGVLLDWSAICDELAVLINEETEAHNRLHYLTDYFRLNENIKRVFLAVPQKEEVLH